MLWTKSIIWLKYLWRDLSLGTAEYILFLRPFNENQQTCQCGSTQYRWMAQTKPPWSFRTWRSWKKSWILSTTIYGYWNMWGQRSIVTWLKPACGHLIIHQIHRLLISETEMFRFHNLQGEFIKRKYFDEKQQNLGDQVIDWVTKDL